MALCRPSQGGDAFRRPATNQQIADEPFHSVAAVKTHPHVLLQRFELRDLPQTKARALAQLSLNCGAVTSADFRTPA